MISSGMAAAASKMSNEERFAINHNYNDAAPTLAGTAPALAVIAAPVAAARAVYIVAAAQIGWGLGALPSRRRSAHPDLGAFAATLDEVA